MLNIRRSEDRGRGDHGWLKSRHSFSFADYHDPAQMGFSVLRVINEDRIAPAAGFPTHGHRDMEILTYVLEGALEHRDSLGSGSVIRPGEVQRMSAGTGIRHSEFNASNSEAVHLLQIWILPDRRGIPPSYEQQGFDLAASRGRFLLLASPDGRDGSVRIHRDATLAVATLAPGETINQALGDGRQAWLQVARGEVALDGEHLAAGDGAALSEAQRLSLSARTEVELLLFDLP